MMMMMMIIITLSIVSAFSDVPQRENTANNNSVTNPIRKSRPRIRFTSKYTSSGPLSPVALFVSYCCRSFDHRQSPPPPDTFFFSLLIRGGNNCGLRQSRRCGVRTRRDPTTDRPIRWRRRKREEEEEEDDDGGDMGPPAINQSVERLWTEPGIKCMPFRRRSRRSLSSVQYILYTRDLGRRVRVEKIKINNEQKIHILCTYSTALVVQL